MNNCQIVAKLKENVQNEATTFESFQQLNDYEYLIIWKKLEKIFILEKN